MPPWKRPRQAMAASMCKLMRWRCQAGKRPPGNDPPGAYQMDDSYSEGPPSAYRRPSRARPSSWRATVRKCTEQLPPAWPAQIHRSVQVLPSFLPGLQTGRSLPCLLVSPATPWSPGFRTSTCTYMTQITPSAHGPRGTMTGGHAGVLLSSSLRQAA